MHLNLTLLTTWFKRLKRKQSRTYLVEKKMSKGISNFQIENVFRHIDDPDINKNFVGVSPANHLNRFIDYKSMKKKNTYPFIIANNNSSDKNGTHWLSILDIELKTNLLSFF